MANNEVDQDVAETRKDPYYEGLGQALWGRRRRRRTSRRRRRFWGKK